MVIKEGSHYSWYVFMPATYKTESFHLSEMFLSISLCIDILYFLEGTYLQEMKVWSVGPV
jgi:hypothetical protein